MAKEIIVSAEHNNTKLLKVLQKTAPDIASVGIFKLLRKGKISVNNEKVKDHTLLVKTCDVIAIDDVTSKTPKQAVPKIMEFHPEVLFEDECLYVINKPGGLAVHSGAGDTGQTLIDILNGQRSKQEGQVFLVHRLDKFTTGVLILAKSREIAGKLQDIIASEQDKKITKQYTGIVFGNTPVKGSCIEPLDNRPAETYFSRVSSRRWHDQHLSTLDISIKTGRKHQIRRHFADRGFPIAGDDDHGNWKLNKLFFSEFRIKGSMLHCRRIRFLHPVSNMMMDISAPVPEVFLRVMKTQDNKVHTRPARGTKN